MKRSGISYCTTSGGVLLRGIIAFATLIIIGSAIFTVLRTQQQNQQVYHRKVLAISEYGLMMALQRLFSEPSWTDGIEKTSYEGGWYRVTMRQYMEHDTVFLSIRSEGKIGPASDAKACLVRLTIGPQGDSAWIRESMY